MNPYFRALDEGYDPDEILKFISKAIPNVLPMITKAKNVGYTAKEIIGFLSETANPNERKGLSESERHALNTRDDAERTKRGLKLAASAVALPIAGTVVRNAFARALPSSLIPQSGQGQTPPPVPSGPQVPSAPGVVPPTNGNGISSQLLNQPQPPLPSGQAIPPTGPQPQAPLQPSSQQPPVSPSNIPQQALPAQAQQITPNINEILNKHGLTKHIDKLKEKYKDPKEIAAILYSRFPKEMKQFQDEAAKPMEEAIGDYIGQPAQPEQKALETPEIELTPAAPSPEPEKIIDLTGMGKGMTDNLYKGMFESLQKGSTKFAGIDDPFLKQAKPYFDKGLIKSPEDLKKLKNEGVEGFEKKPLEIAKNETVATPHGIGEVISDVRNNQVLIEDENGKRHKVDVDELEKEPEDVIETVQQLLKIPEVDRSSIVSLFTYDPADKEMYIQFHNGETYKYLDVDPEKVFKVANKMGIPVTEGKNIFGAWSPEDKKSLGATLIKEIINDPKYKKAKKGEEANPNYRQLETLYDYWTALRHQKKKKKK